MLELCIPPVCPILACAPNSRTLPGRTDGHMRRDFCFMMDASNPTQLSASCVQLLGLLSAEPLAEASVLILFNKTDLPCYMTTEEMKSLIRLPDIIACAKQNITMAEISAWKGTGLAGVLRWLQDTHRTSS
ncbi:ADP-ribosylation factor-like protein 16 isoform 1-T1 [Hipposideros larvatus]